MTTLYTTEICLHFGFCQKIANMKCPTLVAFQQHNGMKKKSIETHFQAIKTYLLAMNIHNVIYGYLWMALGLMLPAMGKLEILYYIQGKHVILRLVPVIQNKNSVA